MEHFDLIVIGGGPAGYLGAQRAAQGGMKTALFEERALGGVCLNEGCIPSKTLLHSAKVLDYAMYGDKYGVSADNVTLDHGAVIQRKNKVVKQLVSGIEFTMKKCNVSVFDKRALIKGRSENGFVVLADGIEYSARNLLIATGSSPVLPPIQGLEKALESGFALTNREILDLQSLPESLVVIGGGIVGLEMASYFNSAGVKVTVIEMLENIAGSIDVGISDILMKNYKKKGVEFKLPCKVTGFDNNSVTFEEKGESKTIEASKVLLSVGRKPNIKNIGLENIGVYTEKGAVVTDDKMQTNISGVYAAGDVNGKSMLAHTAYRESEVTVNNMLGKRDFMRYFAIPNVVYTNPEVACVGETKQTAELKGFEVKTAETSMRMSGRYLAEVEGGNGIVKIVVNAKDNRLLGVHLIGSYASEMIFGAALMIEAGMTIEQIKELVFPHPTVCEVIREAAFLL